MKPGTCGKGDKISSKGYADECLYVITPARGCLKRKLELLLSSQPRPSLISVLGWGHGWERRFLKRKPEICFNANAYFPPVA